MIHYAALLATALACLIQLLAPPPPPSARALGLVPHSPTHGHLAGSGTTTNWAGYVVRSKDNHNDYFTQVDGAWTVHATPDVFDDTTSPIDVVSDVSPWVGLGGYGSPVLWQAGTDYAASVCQESTTEQYEGAHWTEHGTWCHGPGCVIASFVYGASGWQQTARSSCDRYTFWYEDYGCSAPAPCPNQGNPVEVPYPLVSPGDRVYVKVTINGQVTFDNLTTGQTATYTVPIDNNRVGLSAEWISEETCSTDLQPCAHPIAFDDPQFSDAYAYGTRMSTYVDIFNYRRVDLTQQGATLAHPTALNHHSHGFGVTCCAAGGF